MLKTVRCSGALAGKLHRKGVGTAHELDYGYGSMKITNQFFRTFFVQGVLLCLLLLLGAACQKKCQQPRDTPFTTFTDQEWRLIESTSPKLNRSLNRSTFIIMVFRRNYTGEIFKVENNDRFEDPVQTFVYNIDPERKLIRVEYVQPQVEGSQAEGENKNASTPIQENVSEYLYELDREFKLTETSYSTYYRFVPFSGVVNPDSTCTF